MMRWAYYYCWPLWLVCDLVRTLWRKRRRKRQREKERDLVEQYRSREKENRG